MKIEIDELKITAKNNDEKDFNIESYAIGSPENLGKLLFLILTNDPLIRMAAILATTPFIQEHLETEQSTKELQKAVIQIIMDSSDEIESVENN